MKRKTKNNLDEMQEQKLLGIERTGFWLAFFGLGAAIMIQLTVSGFVLQNIIGEFIIFMFLAIYIVGACIKNGIWDRKLKADPITNLMASLIAGSVAGIYTGVTSYIRFKALPGTLGIILIVFVLTFGITFALLSIATYFYKKRVIKLNSSLEDNE